MHIMLAKNMMIGHILQMAISEIKAAMYHLTMRLKMKTFRVEETETTFWPHLKCGLRKPP